MEQSSPPPPPSPDPPAPPAPPMPDEPREPPQAEAEAERAVATPPQVQADILSEKAPAAKDARPASQASAEKPFPLGLLDARPEEKAGAETPIFQGPVSLWMGWRALGGSGAAVLFGLGMLIAGWLQNPGWGRQSLVIVGGALLVAGALMLPYLVLSIRCLRYTITTTLIEREKGIFVKRVDSLDLGRVKDVQLSQSILQRCLKIGTLELYSSDRTDPAMRIEDIRDPRPVYEQLRNAVIRLSQKRGIISMDR